jgi:serine protease Do
VLRNGQPMTINVTIGTYGGPHQELADDSNGAPQSGKLGLAVGDLTQDVRQQLQVPASVHGAVIQNVRPASPADDAGLQPGDVILEVDRKPTPSADQFASQVRNDTNGSDLLLLDWSKGNASYRTLHPDNQQNG